MREEISKLSDEFKRAAHKGGPRAFFDATVLEVDNEAYTCDIDLDGVIIPEVRLRSVVSSNHSIDVLPEAGSAIVVGQLQENDFILIAADKITDWRVTVATTIVAVNAAGVQISKGDESMSKILTDVVKAILTIAAPKNVPALNGLLLRIKTLLK
jgi:hypothetical protein